jgi:AraC-like DNA-binding protein
VKRWPGAPTWSSAWGAEKGVARFALFLQLLDLLGTSSDYDILSSPEYSPKLDAETLDVLQRAFVFIYRNFATDIRLADVADLAGMSESAFSRFFKKNTGNTFTDHVNKLRIWQACKLLAEGDTPITDICFEVGYMNISNFNRTFLRQHRMTPSAYRRWRPIVARFGMIPQQADETLRKHGVISALQHAISH